MNKLKKALCMILCVFSLAVCALPAYAYEEVSAKPEITTSSDDSITPYADVIETKYRYHDGKLQYRRWNATRGYWVDANWIDVP